MNSQLAYRHNLSLSKYENIFKKKNKQKIKQKKKNKTTKK